MNHGSTGNTMAHSHDDLIKEHYKTQADKHGVSSASTMEDEVVRQKEIDLIAGFFMLLGRNGLKVLDLGCGNGYTLDVLTRAHPSHAYAGLDFSEDMLTVARQRGLPVQEWLHGDARALPFESSSFDVVYTERCLVNLLEWEGQEKALREVYRVLKPGGYYLMIEGFTDGWFNYNKARRECGLDEISQPYHNRFFDKDLFLKSISDLFDVIDPAKIDPSSGPKLLPANFLSSHYFVARVLHPLVQRGDFVRNSELVKFFSFLPPSGNYSPIQAQLLQKK